MNKRKNNVTSIVTRAIMALVCATGARMAAPVQAQSTVPSITINSCDGSNFPSITCIVTVVDRTGLPAQRLNASAFEVIDGGGVVGGVKADQNVNSSVTTSILFLIDLSSSLRGTGLQSLKDAVDKSLDDMAKDTGRGNDQVALIALNSDKVDVGANPSSPPINPTYEVPFSVDKVLPRNTLRPLNVAGATPLYDGVRKALVMTSNQPMGRRAIIVMSDGFDSKSSAFTIDSDITMAQRDVTPMFTLKIGSNADNAKLQRLAIDSGGEVLVPGSPTDFSAAIKKIQDRLKTQYALTFKTGAAVGTKPDISIRWKTTSGTVEQKATTITKLPSAPTVLTGFRINGDAGDLNNTPLKGDVTIEPDFKGPAPTQVQYELDGQKEVKKQSPWSFSFNTSQLAPDAMLTVRIFNAGNISSTVTYALVIDAASATATPAPTKTPVSGLATVTNNPTLLIAIAVAFIGLLVLVVLVIVLVARRKQAAPIYPNSTPEASFSPPTSIQQEIPTALYQSQPPPDSVKTQVFQRPEEANASMKTQLWQLPKAKLEFTGVMRKGDKAMIGLAGQEVQVGREVDETSGNIKIPSVHVSRQHAVFKMEGDAITITDMGSTSGTRVNGQKIAAHVSTPVKVGDTIDFADVTTVVVEP